MLRQQARPSASSILTSFQAVLSLDSELPSVCTQQEACKLAFFDLRSKPGPQSKLIQLSLVLSFQSLLPSVPPQTSPHTFSFQRRLLVSVVKKSRGHHDQNSLTKQGSVCMKQFLMRSWQRNESEILAWQEEEDGRNSGPAGSGPLGPLVRAML